MSPGSWGPNFTFKNQIILPVAQQLALVSLCQWILRLHLARLGVCLDFALRKGLKFGLNWWCGFLQHPLTARSIWVWRKENEEPVQVLHSLVFYHQVNHQVNLTSNSVDEKINNDCCTHFYWVKFQTFTYEKGGLKVLLPALTWA